jgi:hypothetical protein
MAAPLQTAGQSAWFEGGYHRLWRHVWNVPPQAVVPEHSRN